MIDANLSDALQQQVAQAIDTKTPLNIVGGNSKAFYGNPANPAYKNVSTDGHSGIVSYEPSELVVTVRSGTPLKALEALLDKHRQQLPFEPPHFSDHSTVGGAVAAGLSGPARFRLGAVRDSVLGVKIINGRGEVLRFGGEVMKNVAGYDLSRLMAGSMGTLGLLLEVSLKLRAKAPQTLTLQHQVSESQARELQRQWFQLPGILTATAYHKDTLSIRLAGSEKTLAAMKAKIGGETLENSDSFWKALKNQQLPFFTEASTLWRVAVPPMSPALHSKGETLEEWGGGQRWISAGLDETEHLREQAAKLGGHATLFRTTQSDHKSADISRFHPLAAPLMQLHHSLKKSLDPHGIFTPGRLYKGL